MGMKRTQNTKMREKGGKSSDLRDKRRKEVCQSPLSPEKDNLVGESHTLPKKFKIKKTIYILERYQKKVLK
jgi:hypothetical protein